MFNLAAATPSLSSSSGEIKQNIYIVVSNKFPENSWMHAPHLLRPCDDKKFNKNDETIPVRK
jgi:hypothetical protein